MTPYAEQAKQARLKLLTIEQGHFNISQTTRKLLKRNAELLDTLARVEAVSSRIFVCKNTSMSEGVGLFREHLMKALEGEDERG